MRTSVVIVNWNAGALLAECVAGVSAQLRPGDEIVLVDNGSTDGSLAPVVASHPTVRVVETGANLGFAAGANRGADAARGDVLLFLNPDARPAREAVALLADTLALVPGAGFAGGGLVDAAGRWQPAAARFGALAHLLLDTTPGRLPARWRRRPYAVEWVYGTFMAVRRDLFRQLGGFDVRFFMYGEDMDLCHRAARVGARTILVPGARAIHHGAVSAGARFGGGRDAEVVKGELRFYALRTTPGTLRAFRTVGALKFGAKAVVAALLGRREAMARNGAIVRACLGFRPEWTT